MKPCFFILVFAAGWLSGKAQMIVRDIKGVSYTTKSYAVASGAVNFSTTDNIRMSLKKSEVAYIRESDNVCVTFLSGKRRKYKVVATKIDPEKMSVKGKLDAIRFFKTDNKPASEDPEYIKSFKEETSRIRSNRTLKTMSLVTLIIISAARNAVMADNSIP